MKVIIFLITFLISFSAFAADSVPSHDWIQEGWGLKCCTPQQHCFPIERNTVELTSSGALVKIDDREKEVKRDRIYGSQDGLTWFCDILNACLFLPPES